MFIYEGHRIKVKVMGNENLQNAYYHNVNFDNP